MKYYAPILGLFSFFGGLFGLIFSIAANNKEAATLSLFLLIGSFMLNYVLNQELMSEEDNDEGDDQ